MSDRFALARLVLGLLAVGCVAPSVTAEAPVATGFLNGQVEANGQTMAYVVYVPRNYTADEPWPVILYLQGAHAEGRDGLRPLINTLARGSNDSTTGKTSAGGLGVAVMRNPQRFPCLVVFPQLPPSGLGWRGLNEALTFQILEQVVGTYNGDRSRLYLIGHSLGGEGVWQLASDRPELFAAAIPVASTNFSRVFSLQRVQALKSLPLWVFHGDHDTLNNPAISRRWVQALQAAGNTNVQYTEFAGLGHNVWDMVFDDPQLIAWLLAQKR